MISLWLAAYLWHVLEVTPDTWFSIPFIITALVSIVLEFGGYMFAITWLESR